MAEQGNSISQDYTHIMLVDAAHAHCATMLIQETEYINFINNRVSSDAGPNQLVHSTFDRARQID